MTNAELKVLSDLCHDFVVIREEFDKCREELALEKKCHEEVCEEALQRADDNKRLEEGLLRISEGAANAKQTGYDLQQDIFKLTEERDAARRENDCLREGLGKIVRFRDAMISMSDDDEKTRITKEIVANKFAGFAKAALAAASGESEEGGAK